MKTLALLLFCCITAFANGQTLPVPAINDIDGHSINLSSSQGTKILLIISPVWEYDSLRINEIDSFRIIYGNKIKIIGVLSFENGYEDSNKVKIKALYADRGVNLVLTEGMYTQKGSGARQSPLFHWLANKTENKRFNIDAIGIGQKYIIGGDGKLYAVLGPEVPLFAPPVVAFINRKKI